jgi:hypothetical protein
MPYDPNNSGTLGKNKNKQSEKDPDSSGTIIVHGVPYYLSGWTKTNGQTGEKFISLAIESKEEKDRKKAEREREKAEKSNLAKNNQNPSELDDVIPF